MNREHTWGEDDIRRLLTFLGRTDITEFTLELEGLRLHVRREPGQAPAAPPAEEEVPEEETNLFPILSPMVGTFYAAPAPGADPFVKEGDEVMPGQTVAIIEAMKVMNEVVAERPGRVVRILVENAEPVEYGQPLMLLEPL